MTVDLKIMNARLLDRPGLWDLDIQKSTIASVEQVGRRDAEWPEGSGARTLDARGDLVVRPFCDPHFHLDKVLTRDHFGATTPQEAFTRARDVKKNFTAADVEARATQALELAAANGIGAVRAQCDVDSFTTLASLEGVLAVKERFAGLVDLQVVAFPQEGIVADPQTVPLLREALRMGADLVGGLPEIESTVGDQLEHLSTVFGIAEEFNVDIDMHIDYVDDPGLKTLEMLADITRERRFHGHVTADHCCALSQYADDEAARVIEKVKATDLAVTVMPMANLQMLGGGRTPYNRGSSRLGELLDADVNVAVGSDNMSDIWYRFNRLDPAELGLVTSLSGGLRSDEDVRAAFDLTNGRAARVMGLASTAITPGTTADLVVLNAATVDEFFRNLPGRRTMVRAGKLAAGSESSMWVAQGTSSPPDR